MSLFKYFAPSKDKCENACKIVSSVAAQGIMEGFTQREKVPISKQFRNMVTVDDEKKRVAYFIRRKINCELDVTQVKMKHEC